MSDDEMRALDAMTAERNCEGCPRCRAMREFIVEWEKGYPTDVFPEPPSGKHGKTVDSCSAAIARHVLKRMREFFDGEWAEREQE